MSEMIERKEIVEPGAVIWFDNGQFLTVTDQCAVGKADQLFVTKEWVRQSHLRKEEEARLAARPRYAKVWASLVKAIDDAASIGAGILGRVF